MAAGGHRFPQLTFTSPDLNCRAASGNKAASALKEQNESGRQHECGKYREEGKHGSFGSPQQDTALPWGLRDLENTKQCSRMGKAIRPREKLCTGSGQGKRPVLSQTRGVERRGQRSWPGPHPECLTPDSAHGSRLPHKWLWDVKEACVLLEPDDSDLFPAHLSG